MKRVLFVDDQPEILDIAKIFLTQNGLDTTVAGSAKRALELLKEQKFDAVISDYMMPGMDGLELLKNLRRKGDSTPFIILTAKENEGVVLEALDNGADFYMQKQQDPKVQYATLAHMVRKSIENRRMAETLFFSELNVRALPKDTKVIAVLLDPNLRLVFCSDPFLKLTGWRLEEIVGKDWISTFVPGGRQDKVRADILKLTGSSKDVNQLRLITEMVTRHGDRIVVSWESTSLRDPAGNVVCISCVGKDETTMRLKFENEIQMRFESGGAEGTAK